MFAVIRKGTKEKILTTCRTREAAFIAAQLEKEKLPFQERKLIRAVCLDDEGFVELKLR